MVGRATFHSAGRLRTTLRRHLRSTPPPAGADDEQTIEDFTRLWYEKHQRRTWRTMAWLGVPLQQTPTDAWMYQEIIVETLPDVIIEVGVKRGGCTLYLASILDLVRSLRNLPPGRVLGVDRGLDNVHPGVRSHPSIELIESDSVSDDLHARLTGITNALVLLDSNHTADHVYRELDLFSRYVAISGYLIVGDTAINGHPVLAGWGEGPYEAVARWLSRNPAFEVDVTRERFLLTISPRGFLRRIA